MPSYHYLRLVFLLRVQNEVVYLHPDLEFWTYLIANSSHSDKFWCFRHL